MYIYKFHELYFRVTKRKSIFLELIDQPDFNVNCKCHKLRLLSYNIKV